MTIGPRSLGGQVALLLAVALLVAQSINFVLLLQSRDQLREAQAEGAMGRIVTLFEREDVQERLGRGASFRPGRFGRPIFQSDEPVAARYQLRRQTTNSLRMALAETDLVAETALAAYMTADEARALRSDDRPGGQGPRRRPREPREPRPSLLVSIEITEGRWINVTQPLQPDPPLGLAGLAAQTLITYLAVLGAALILTRRISRPLADLRTAASEVMTDRNSARLIPDGPEDVQALTRAFEDMRNRVEHLFAEKNVMLGAIGHDLRTPLTSLRIRVESIGDEKLRDAMIASLDDLALQLDDILSLARNEEAAPPLEDVNVREFVQDVVGRLPEIAKHIQIIDVPDQSVRIRPTWLARAVQNLLENAVRYGDVAHVSATCEPSELVFHITDEGPGLPDEMLESVKAPFVRGEQSRNKGTGGAGLGLAIVQRLAIRHGGSLTLANRGKGGLSAILRVQTDTAPDGTLDG